MTDNQTLSMENFLLKGGHYTPTIELNANTGTLLFEGEAYPEDSAKFFSQIDGWLTEFLSSWNDTVKLVFKMSYFNTSASGWFLQILITLKNYQKKSGNEVIVEWHYKRNDIDMKEAGEEYAEDVELAINMIEHD